MNYIDTFENIESTSDDVIYVDRNEIGKAIKILTENGIDCRCIPIKDINALGLLKYSEFTKEKIMERIPEEEKNNITFEDIVSTVGNYCESNIIECVDLNDAIDDHIKQAETVSKIFNESNKIK